VWFEITNLMIPGLNDDPEETRKLAQWILDKLGPDVPLHFTGIPPGFQATRQHARRQRVAYRAAHRPEVGLHYVYEGNIYSDGANTNCPSAARCWFGGLARCSGESCEEWRLRTLRVAIAGTWPGASPLGQGSRAHDADPIDGNTPP